MNRLMTLKGSTLIEILIALFLTGVITMVGFRFYVQMHNHVLAQEEISDMQQNSRITLQEIVSTLRMAGYKIGSHAPYSISGDSLYVFFNDTQPVDTVLYYLMEYGDIVVQEPAPKKLLKKVNSSSPTVYSDYIRSLTFSALSSSTIEISLEVQTSKANEDFTEEDGIGTFTLNERVTLRNVGL